MENAECLLQKIESDNLWTGELELKRNYSHAMNYDDSSKLLNSL